MGLPGGGGGGVTGLHRLIKEKHEKILSETTRPRAFIFSVKHHLVDLYQVCSNYAPGANKWAGRRGRMFCIDLYRENLKKSSCLKPQAFEP